MNISGVIVHSRPENIESVREQLDRQPGIEVHGISDDGRLVVTVETDSDGAMADAVVGLQNMAGVIAAAMVYHHFEDLNNESEFAQQEASA